MQYSNIIKKIKAIKNLNNNQLAQFFNVSTSTINNWEKEITIPNSKHKIAINQFCEKTQILVDFNKPNFTTLKLITSSQIKTWFNENQHKARAIFPELINKLIKESCRYINQILFPTMDSINVDGEDGETDVSDENNQFVPSGHSYWELGATVNYAREKINSDFNNRTNVTPKEVQKETNIVFVTPKEFKNKTKMELCEKFKEGSYWKKIIILDSIDLEEWLSRCFLTSIWLVDFFEKMKLNILSISKAVNQIELETEPKTSYKLYLAERSDEVEKLNSLLEEKNCILISGPSFFESYRFVIFSIAQQINKFDNVIICNDYESFNKLDNFVEKTILIANFSFPKNNSLCSKNIHIICAGNEKSDLKFNIILQPRLQGTLYQVLRDDMQLDSAKINFIKPKAKNNVMLIAREIASESYICSNIWFNDQSINELIPISILGKIHLDNQNDKNILNLFLDKKDDVDEYLSKLELVWKNKDNSPIFILNDQIKVNLKEEVFKICGNCIGRKIDLIFLLLSNVFKINNERYTDFNNHQIELSNFKCSNEIILGLFESLILLSIYSEKQYEIDKFISDFLHHIDTKEKLFHVSSYFKYIAEISPLIFINYILECLEKENSILNYLFSNNSSNMLYISNESFTLIRTLEKLTYLDDTKIKACNCLFKLGTKEYVYDKNNSPQETIVNALHYTSNNALTFEEKYDFVRMLIKKYNEKSFYIPLELIKKNDSFHFEPIFIYRNICLIKDGPEKHSILEMNKNYVSLILKSANNFDIKIIKKIISAQPNLNYTSLDEIEKYICDNYGKDNIKQYELYEYMQIELYRYIKFMSKFVPKTYIVNFEKIINMIKPNDYLEENLIYLKDFGLFGCPNISCINDEQEIEYKNVLIFRQKLLIDLINKYGEDLVIDSIIHNLSNDFYSGMEFYKIITDYKVNAIIFKYCIFYKKYAFISGFLNNLSENEIDEFIDSADSSTVNDLAKNFSYNTYVPKRFKEDQNLTRLVYKNRVNINLSDEKEVEMIKLYNPFEYLKKMTNNKTYINKSNLNEICDLLLSIDLNVMDKENSYNMFKIEEVLNFIDSFHNNEKVKSVCFKYLDYFKPNYVPNSIKEYFFDNPNEYIEYITNKQLDNTNLNILNRDMVLPENFDVDSQKFCAYIESFMNYNGNDSENVQYYLGGILFRSFKKFDITFMDIIEKLSSTSFENGIVGEYLKNSQVINVYDNNLKLIYNNLKKKSKEVEIEYPKTSRILEKIASYYKCYIEDNENIKFEIDGLL